jgi:hypothetical protein
VGYQHSPDEIGGSSYFCGSLCGHLSSSKGTVEHTEKLVAEMGFCHPAWLPVWLSEDLKTSRIDKQLEKLNSLLVSERPKDAIAAHPEHRLMSPTLELAISLKWALESLLPRGLNLTPDDHRRGRTILKASSAINKIVDTLMCLASVHEWRIEYPPITFYEPRVSFVQTCDQLKSASGILFPWMF